MSSGADAVAVLQLSDVHLTPAPGELFCGRDPDERLRIVVEASVRKLPRVDLVLLSGDQTHDGGDEANRRLLDALAPLGAPVLAIRGNHDLLDVHRRVFGEPHAVELGAWRVVGWDTSVPNADHGHVDVEALAGELDALDERPTLLALHHPPVSPTTNPIFQLERADELLAALSRRPQVRALLSGHVHTPFELARNGLRLLGGPSVCVPFEHRDGELIVDAGGPTGARVLFLNDDGTMTTEVIEA